jgi:hypothetical protein
MSQAHRKSHRKKLEEAQDDEILNELEDDPLQSLGNQGVQKIVAAKQAQAKLRVSQTGDPQEREADRIAEQVMKGPSSSAAAQDPARQLVDRVLAKASRVITGGGVSEAQVKGLKGDGEPLKPKDRQFFENRFGADFSHVKIHTNRKAAGLAESINARAFTYGNHIAFDKGEFQPGTTEGKKLIAHELTHVVQQGKATKKAIDRKPALTGATDKLRLAGENSLAERIQNSELKINFLPLKGALGYNRQGEQNTIHIDSSLKGDSSETQSKLASVIAHEAKHNEGERRESEAHKAGGRVYKSLKQKGAAKDGGFLKGIQEAKTAKGAEKRNVGGRDYWRLFVRRDNNGDIMGGRIDDDKSDDLTIIDGDYTYFGPIKNHTIHNSDRYGSLADTIGTSPYGLTLALMFDKFLLSPDVIERHVTEWETVRGIEGISEEKQIPAQTEKNPNYSVPLGVNIDAELTEFLINLIRNPVFTGTYEGNIDLFQERHLSEWAREVREANRTLIKNYIEGYLAEVYVDPESMHPLTRSRIELNIAETAIALKEMMDATFQRPINAYADVYINGAYNSVRSTYNSNIRSTIENGTASARDAWLTQDYANLANLWGQEPILKTGYEGYIYNLLPKAVQDNLFTTETYLNNIRTADMARTGGLMAIASMGVQYFANRMREIWRSPSNPYSYHEIEPLNWRASGTKDKENLIFGQNSNGHLIKHRDVLGYGHLSAQEAQKMIPELRAAANDLYKNANPALTRIGRWHVYNNARFYICDGKMIIVQSNGTLITTINKTSNMWYNNAIPIR